MSPPSTAIARLPWPARLRRKQASDYLRERHGITLSTATLAKLAVVGGGPAFRKDGPFPLYELDILDAFANARLGPLRTSTGEGRGPDR
jgi:hypothetical protein